MTLRDVVTIGDRGFYGCSELTRVTIPAGVSTIGQNAFDGCLGLRSVKCVNPALLVSAFGADIWAHNTAIYDKVRCEASHRGIEWSIGFGNVGESDVYVTCYGCGAGGIVAASKGMARSTIKCGVEWSIGLG